MQMYIHMRQQEGWAHSPVPVAGLFAIAHAHAHTRSPRVMAERVVGTIQEYYVDREASGEAVAGGGWRRASEVEGGLVAAFWEREVAQTDPRASRGGRRTPAPLPAPSPSPPALPAVSPAATSSGEAADKSTQSRVRKAPRRAPQKPRTAGGDKEAAEMLLGMAQGGQAAGGEHGGQAPAQAAEEEVEVEEREVEEREVEREVEEREVEEREVVVLDPPPSAAGPSGRPAPQSCKDKALAAVRRAADTAQAAAKPQRVTSGSVQGVRLGGAAKARGRWSRLVSAGLGWSRLISALLREAQVRRGAREGHVTSYLAPHFRARWAATEQDERRDEAAQASASRVCTRCD